MTTELFDRYASIIRDLKEGDLVDVNSLPISLQIDRDASLTAYYPPFDYVNTRAKIVLVGVTPGFTQARNALIAARNGLKAGESHGAALMAAKQVGAFSGSLRPNLVAMLDYLKLNQWLGVSTCDELFANASHLVQTTSVLRFPVFINDANYNGTPNMTKHPMLQKMLKEYFVQEVKMLGDAIFIPLGPTVSEAMSWLGSQGLIDVSRVFDGIPHPSGANAERIAYFLGKKQRSDLSSKTNPEKIDQAKAELQKKISGL
ncbi:hypothetical protein [Polynucleobacter antarcticus]|uniref:Uracil DNA glycosylase superfamily protein n=1 Tax=Polynucleobacter antarcticus TaxID=1743162 RepID=A0A6M9PYK4_9BURK|nr:hypothetical protein [Polynucleobacter antarcticus]QKM62936.1 hypothetical protein DCO16_07630 [Polynucleobacter antarcticus]